MRFWDSSALVPLLLEEPTSAFYRQLLTEDPAMTVWVLTRTEMTSAVRRKERAGELGRSTTLEALRRLRLLERSWAEVDAVDPVRDRAERLLAVHPLRAADSLQLAAALILCEERPRGWELVTADQRLADAALAEGFDVVWPG